jgi:hypothetical protein
MSIEQDLVLREYWIGYLRERSLEALGERFHITPCAIWCIEKQASNGRKDARNAQIRQLRAQYRSANRTQMPKFHIKAIAKRNGVSEATVTRRRMAAIEAKAQAVYDRRIAA